MSVITETSPKHCAAKQSSSAATTSFHKKLYFYLSTLLLSLLSLTFLIYLTLHPSKPLFSLQEADITQLDLSSPSPSLLNSSIQITLNSHNPNSRLAIFYDDLLLYASYKAQRITPETPVSPFYQDRQETNLLTASLVGLQLPVAPSFAYEVQRDRVAGRLPLVFKGMGRLRWKVGSWVSGRYRFVVTCVAIMPIVDLPSPPLRSRQSSQCQTTM